MSETKRSRATDAVLTQRVEETLLCRLNGAEIYDLRAYAKEKAWDVSDRQLRRYIAAADDLIAESLEQDRDKVLRRHLAQRKSLYARALNDGDLRTALAVAKDEAELQGLYPAKKHELTEKSAVTLQIIQEIVPAHDPAVPANPPAPGPERLSEQ